MDQYNIAEDVFPSETAVKWCKIVKVALLKKELEL
jgi:hypothetical protein